MRTAFASYRRTLLLLACAMLVGPSLAFTVKQCYETVASAHRTTTTVVLNRNLGCGKMARKDENAESDDEGPEYRNLVTSVLSNFMGNNKKEEQEPKDPLAHVDFNVPKLSKKLDLDLLARMLDAELYEKEWFVTGNVNAMYFSNDFSFQDPDVRVDGIEDYARGVYKIFDQETSRAEIISTTVKPESENVITCKWRLSGKANIGPGGLTIKPYIVYTDFTIDPNSGLIIFQEDRFDLPSWDILLSSLFPFLIGKVTAPPAPPVEPRVVKMPKY